MTGETPEVHEALAVYAPETTETERVPEGYKQTEVGVIPEDWEICELQDLGQWKGGATPSMRNPAYWTDGSIPWASSGDIKVVLLEKTHSSITETAVKQTSTSLLPKNCIIVVTRSGILRKYLPVAKNTVSLAINQDLKALLPNKDVEADFVLHQLIANGPEILATCQKSGTTVESIEYAWLKSFFIPKPSSKDEQRAIAAALSDVDALIFALDKLIAKKRAVKTAAMQQLLTGKQRLPGFSGEWEVKRLGDVAPLQRGFDLTNSMLKKGSYPVVYSNGVLNHHTDFMVKGPGVVTGRSGTIGKVSYVEEDYWPHNTALWVTDFKGNSPKFIYHLYKNIGLDRFGTGSGVPTLNRNDVHAFSVSVPSNEEQTAIAAVLSDMDAEIEALEARREKTRQVKRGMMQELLTGWTRLI